ncbi:MAG TPA: sialate O-acetylesterase [Planctomycetaceae bacterium]|nr:sialate O-acetylesterase [Planctomycetaceae bacterium]
MMQPGKTSTRCALLMVVCFAVHTSLAEEVKKPTRPFPGNEKADIWLLAGQSNMGGWGLLKAPIETDPRVMEFKSPDWVPAENPAHQNFVSPGWDPNGKESVRDNILRQRDDIRLPEGLTPEGWLQQAEARGLKLGGVGPGLFFAKNLSRAISRPIGLVNWSYGGGAIKRWAPEKAGATTNTKVQEILDAIGPIKGVIWYQGETDALLPETAEAYGDALLGLVDSLRHDTRDPDLPFVCVQIGRYAMRADEKTNLGWEKVREAQRMAARKRKNVFLTSAIDLLTDDPIHVSFEGHERLGKRIAEVASSMVYKLPARGRPIDLVSAEVIQPQSERPMIRLRFSGVTGRLRAAGRATGFELRQTTPGSDVMRMAYRVDFDRDDPSALIVGVWRPFKQERDQLIYGMGVNPYVNIVDEKDMPVPAFGPIDLEIPN